MTQASETQNWHQTDAATLASTEIFADAVLFIARAFVSIYAKAPRTTTLFGTQQRWLLCHAGLAYHFQAEKAAHPGLTKRNLGQIALQYGIASRNTAHAFFAEALKYEVIQFVDEERIRVAPAAAALALLVGWFEIHLRALDMLDGDRRGELFLANAEQLLPVISPLMAKALLSSADVRSPKPLYTIFTWSDAGGHLMDRLIAGMQSKSPSPEGRYLTDVVAIAHLAETFGLSRAHASRKIAAAESIGGVGWSGRRGHSPLWISHTFFEEYALMQANKLLLLENAFREAMGGLEPPAISSR